MRWQQPLAALCIPGAGLSAALPRDAERVRQSPVRVLAPLLLQVQEGRQERSVPRALPLLVQRRASPLGSPGLPVPPAQTAALRQLQSSQAQREETL